MASCACRESQKSRKRAKIHIWDVKWNCAGKEMQCNAKRIPQPTTCQKAQVCGRVRASWVIGTFHGCFWVHRFLSSASLSLSLSMCRSPLTLVFFVSNMFPFNDYRSIFVKLFWHSRIKALQSIWSLFISCTCRRTTYTTCQRRVWNINCNRSQDTLDVVKELPSHKSSQRPRDRNRLHWLIMRPVASLFSLRHFDNCNGCALCISI